MSTTIRARRRASALRALARLRRDARLGRQHLSLAQAEAYTTLGGWGALPYHLEANANYLPAGIAPGGSALAFSRVDERGALTETVVCRDGQRFDLFEPVDLDELAELLANPKAPK